MYMGLLILLNLEPNPVDIGNFKWHKLNYILKSMQDVSFEMRFLFWKLYTLPVTVSLTCPFES